MAFTEREFLLLRMSVVYAHANVDEMNEAFAYTPEHDPENDARLITVGGDILPEASSEEMANLHGKFGIDKKAKLRRRHGRT